MIPFIQKPAITRSQKTAALFVAMVVDFIQLPGFAFFMEGGASPFEDGLDFVTAVVLTAICGFRWQLGLAFLVELLPVVDLFPTWTAVVLSLPVEVGRPLPAQDVEVIRVPPVQGP